MAPKAEYKRRLSFLVMSPKRIARRRLFSPLDAWWRHHGFWGNEDQNLPGAKVRVARAHAHPRGFHDYFSHPSLAVVLRRLLPSINQPRF
jgi:hypothetical protein